MPDPPLGNACLPGSGIVEHSSGVLRGRKASGAVVVPPARAGPVLALRSARRDGIFREQLGPMPERSGSERKEIVVSFSHHMLRLRSHLRSGASSLDGFRGPGI